MFVYAEVLKLNVISAKKETLIGFFNIDGLVWVNTKMGVVGDSRLANQPH